ncbi:hypothetical protein B0H16DRAFT_1469606 [Mycena metata]|uniref:Uncharacterized protein n=1 Tax=Mycena metata TaxID=1033252 RepID=A0AAD7HYV5_9AGAR|nr:hypothetical protein B0H16DRAFT_1469606 [Mycena metata]
MSHFRAGPRIAAVGRFSYFVVVGPLGTYMLGPVNIYGTFVGRVNMNQHATARCCTALHGTARYCTAQGKAAAITTTALDPEKEGEYLLRVTNKECKKSKKYLSQIGRGWWKRCLEYSLGVFGADESKLNDVSVSSWDTPTLPRQSRHGGTRLFPGARAFTALMIWHPYSTRVPKAIKTYRWLDDLEAREVVQDTLRTYLQSAKAATLKSKLLVRIQEISTELDKSHSPGQIDA